MVIRSSLRSSQSAGYGYQVVASLLPVCWIWLSGRRFAPPSLLDMVIRSSLRSSQSSGYCYQVVALLLPTPLPLPPPPQTDLNTVLDVWSPILFGFILLSTSSARIRSSHSMIGTIAYSWTRMGTFLLIVALFGAFGYCGNFGIVTGMVCSFSAGK